MQWIYILLNKMSKSLIFLSEILHCINLEEQSSLDQYKKIFMILRCIFFLLDYPFITVWIKYVFQTCQNNHKYNCTLNINQLCRHTEVTKREDGCLPSHLYDANTNSSSTAFFPCIFYFLSNIFCIKNEVKSWNFFCSP